MIAHPAEAPMPPLEGTITDAGDLVVPAAQVASLGLRAGEHLPVVPLAFNRPVRSKLGALSHLDSAELTREDITAAQAELWEQFILSPADADGESPGTSH